MIMLRELLKMLNQEWKCLRSTTTTVLSETNCTKNDGCESLTFWLY